MPASEVTPLECLAVEQQRELAQEAHSFGPPDGTLEEFHRLVAEESNGDGPQH
ncbi:MAG: hypothetical protein ACT4QA_20945 [Panacagrimonas sp.]